MDYDDNDFQSQNLHLAGEGSTKFPPVLRPYNLPKFDFDENLQGHLRFDSLVDTEVFLGIESNEDNQWIDAYSRVSSGIEFNSTAAETSSILRHTNVWSEATSSESVEMLLKSVGQEDFIPREAVIQESDACDELACLANQMDSNPKPDEKIEFKDNVTVTQPPSCILANFSGSKEDAGQEEFIPREPTIQESDSRDELTCLANQMDPNPKPDEKIEFKDNSTDTQSPCCIHENLSGLKEDVEMEESMAGISQGCEGKSSIDGSLNILKPPDMHSHSDLPDSGVILFTDGKYDDTKQRKVGVSADGSLNEETNDNSSASVVMANVNEASTEENIPSTCGILKVQNVQNQIVGMGDDDQNSLQTQTSKQDLESSVNNKDSSVATETLDVNTIEGEPNHSDNPLCLIHMEEALEDENVVEGLATETSTLKKSLNTVSDGISNLQKTESGSEDACFRDLSQGNAKIDTLLDPVSGDQFAPNTSNVPKIPIKDDSSSEGKDACFRDLSLGNENKDNLLIKGPLTDNQSALNTRDIPKIVIKDDSSSEAHKVEVSNSDCGTFPNYQLDTVMIEKTFGESSVSKKKELVNIGNQKDSEDLLCKSETSMFDVVDKNTSVVSEGNSDNRASFSSFNTVVSSKSCILGETTQVCENNKSDKLGDHKSFGEDISVIDQGSEKAPFDSSTIHCDVDQSHLPEKGICPSSLGAGHRELKRMKCVGSASVDEKEDFEAKKVEEAGSSLPVGSSELEVDPCPVAGTENKNNSDNTRQILCETKNGCLDNLDTTATEKIGEPQETQTGKVDHECTKEANVAAVLYESIEKPGDEVNATANLNPPVFELMNKDATITSSSDHDHKENDVSKNMDATNTPSSDHDHKGNDVSKDGRSLAPEVDLLANLSEKDVTDLTQIGANAGERGPFPVIAANKESVAVAESLLASELGPPKPNVAGHVSHGSPQVPDGGLARSVSKGTPERKTRRAPNKTAGKDSPRKGSKGKTPARRSEKGGRSTSASLSPSSGFQLMQSKEAHHYYGKIDSISTKPFPDLNTSTSPSVLFQQPFMDVQQIQLRAQIFVYGALIQGIVPEEAHMLSAFGGPDGGRNFWEKTWSSCLERQRGHKSHPINPETPLQARSGTRTPDLAVKRSELQGKGIPSPLGLASSKCTPTTVNPFIPLSSPLWSLPTPSCDSLQSSAHARGPALEYSQALGSLHPNQTPPLRNFLGHNTSRMSQTPLRGPWIASTTALDNSSYNSASPVADIIKSSSIKGTSLPSSSSTKNVPPGLPASSVGLQSVFLPTTPLFNTNNVTVSHAQHSSDPKSKKRKKVTIESEDLGQKAMYLQSHPVSTPVVSSHISTPIATATPVMNVPVTTVEKSVESVSPLSLADRLKTGWNVESSLMSDESLTKIEEARINAEEASALSAAAGATGTNSSSSIIGAAKEVSRRRVEAASFARKRAENMDAIVKAAELAAEAVSQAGKIVTMGDPLPLSDLVEAGPEGCWKTFQESSQQVGLLKGMSRGPMNVDNVGDRPEISQISNRDISSAETGKQIAASEESPFRKVHNEMSLDHMRSIDDISSIISINENSSNGSRGCKVSNLVNPVDVLPESGTEIQASLTDGNGSENLEDNSIKVDSHVEGFKAAWFTANILSLKDGKAYVCYNTLVADEGPLKEWVSLEGEGGKPPRIRATRSLTSFYNEGTRKRQRAAMVDYWSIGDRVDAWIHESWQEGVITDKKKDKTFAVHFPASGETSDVGAWHLRPALIWNDGKWIESSKVGENNSLTNEGDTPREKRPKLGSPARELANPSELRFFNLTEDDKVFNVGKNNKNEKKPDSHRLARSGLQKEGPRVIFGVPKPGKKKKFMDVSKHYVADGTSRINDGNDSVKIANSSIPHASGSRGWNNNSIKDTKEKPGADFKPISKLGRPQNVLGRVISSKQKPLSNSNANDLTNRAERIKDTSNHFNNASQRENQTERASNSGSTGAAPTSYSSRASSTDSHPSKKPPTSRVSKGKFAPGGGRSGKVEAEKALNGNKVKSTSEEVLEPRRSNRKIQPTSRLLEGIQSSLIITKTHSGLQEKGHKR
ncbi:hypothetical protein TSUD_156190, partial [Trifolium subterraneum]